MIIPVSFIFNEFRNAHGRKIVLDATPVVRSVVRSPISGHNPRHFFPPLPPEKVAVGTVASPLIRDFVSITGLADALNYLIKGAPYGGQYRLRNPEGYPNLLGMMTWSMNLDQWSMNFLFSNTLGPLLHDLSRTCPETVCLF